jgi:hypothetical protein
VFAFQERHSKALLAVEEIRVKLGGKIEVHRCIKRMASSENICSEDHALSDGHLSVADSPLSASCMQEVAAFEAKKKAEQERVERELQLLKEEAERRKVGLHRTLKSILAQIRQSSCRLCKTICVVFNNQKLPYFPSDIGKRVPTIQTSTKRCHSYYEWITCH